MRHSLHGRQNHSLLVIEEEDRIDQQRPVGKCKDTSSQKPDVGRRRDGLAGFEQRAEPAEEESDLGTGQDPDLESDDEQTEELVVTKAQG